MGASATVERRPFEPCRDARRGVFVLDGDSKLCEVVGVRGQPPKAAWQRPAPNAAVRLLDVKGDLPLDPFEELERAEWIPLAEAEKSLRVVVPAAADS